MPFSFPSSPTVGQQSTQNQRVYQYTSAGVWELVASPASITSTNISDSTAAGRAILTAADAAAQRTAMGTAASSHTHQSADISDSTSFGRSLLTAASAADQRTALGLPYATQSEVAGTNTTGSITTGQTALTVASGAGINNGDFVVGGGITPGTIVSSGGGTTSLTLSQSANATLSSAPVTFYKSDRALSPGLVAGALCRAWVNFNGSNGSVRASANVSSVTRNSAGNCTINLTTAMTDTNGSILVSVSATADPTYTNTSLVPFGAWSSASQVRITTRGSYNFASFSDVTNVYVSIFR